MKSIEDLFVRKGAWILPKSGTLGKKAENLLSNSATIESTKDWGFRLPTPSLVIPYEYYRDIEGPCYTILDWINHFFKDIKEVGVSSNSPDEDFGKRRPGQYVSAKIEHLDRPNSTFEIDNVLNSYYSESARLRRQKLRLSEQGMSLLVRPFVKGMQTGSFSNFGDICLITHTDPYYEMDAMQKPSLGKTWVDNKGDILDEHSRATTWNVMITDRLFRLSASLPQIPNKGWEIEYVIKAQEGSEIPLFYVMQTTPIERQPRFAVKPTDRNIFDAKEVIGFGEYKTNGILYLPLNFYPPQIATFDERNKDYCLVTQHGNISTTDSNKRGNILLQTNNAKVVLDVDNSRAYKRGGFSAHITQRFREEGSALAGLFTNELKETLLSQMDYIFRANRKLQGPIYSPIGLRTCADEYEQKATVEMTTEIKPFAKLGDVLAGGIKP